MPIITKETAREMNRRSVESRRKFPLRQVKPPTSQTPAGPNPATAPVSTAISGPVTADDSYRRERLERTRLQIELLDAYLLKAKDAQSVDRITNSLRRLYDVEADLAGRPGRGNRKPAPDRPARQSGPRVWVPGQVVDVTPQNQPQGPPAAPPVAPPEPPKPV